MVLPFNAVHNSRRLMALFVRFFAQKVTVNGDQFAAPCYELIRLA